MQSTAFALQMARPLHGHKVAVRSQIGEIDIVTPISTSVLQETGSRCELQLI